MTVADIPNKAILYDSSQGCGVKVVPFVGLCFACVVPVLEYLLSLTDVHTPWIVNHVFIYCVDYHSVCKGLTVYYNQTLTLVRLCVSKCPFYTRTYVRKYNNARLQLTVIYLANSHHISIYNDGSYQTELNRIITMARDVVHFGCRLQSSIETPYHI